MTVWHRGTVQGAAEKDGGLVRIERLEAASELDGFVYIVSHDLRNSARALTEVPQWLKDDLTTQGVKLSEDVAENFDLLERHARRLDRMLLDLLVYSRVGRMQEVSEFNLSDLIAHVLTECPVPDHLKVDVPSKLPVMRMGYKDAFVLFKSVLENAARHGAQKKGILSISGQRRGEVVTLTFTDNGPGVAEHDLQRVFRPMTTLKRRDECEGSGMGLAVVQRIVDHYGGEILAGKAPAADGFRLRLRLRDGIVTDPGPGVSGWDEEV